MFEPLPRGRPLALRVTAVLAMAGLMMWGCSVAVIWTNESRLVFQARRSHFPPPASSEGLIDLRTTDGIRLEALSLAHERASSYWILFCPPSGATIHGRVRPHLESLHAAGYNVFAFDYRGFGRSPGTPSEAGVYEDALTAYRHLTQRLDVAPQRIILAGRSLGSAVAVELATRVPSAGLLLLSAIDSVPATGSRFYPWVPVSLLATQRFDSMVKAPRVMVPVLQVHAPGDRLVPIDAARALFERFPGRKVMLELPGGHNNVGFAGGESLGGALAQFWPVLSAGTAGEPQRRPAVPLDATSAILDAFRQHAFVGIGDAHGNLRGEAFQLALIRDPRFPTIVNDILAESGNSRYQDLVDRFVRGEDVPRESLQRAWLDTTQQQVASLEIPAIVTTVRSINAALPAGRRLRLLLGEPPIDWERMQTQDDLRKWEAEPLANRDRFAVDLVRREVLARNRRVLALYGAGHLFRKVISESLVTLLEDERTKAFTIWTNAAADMANMQADVAKWPVPSVTHVRGTVLGGVNIAEYFGPSGKDIPPQWRAPMEEQFDAVLYVGPLATITLARPQPWRCSEPAMAERLRRLRLQRPALADRVENECVR